MLLRQKSDVIIQLLIHSKYKRSMMMNNRQSIQMMLFGTSAVTLVILYQQYRRYGQMLSDLPAKAVQRWKEIQHNQNNGDFVLMKDQKKQPSIQWRSQFDIGINMLCWNRIPFPKFRVTHHRYLMMNLQCRKIKLRQYPAEVSIPQMDHKLIQTKTITYTSIFDSNQKPGFFGTIFKYTIATVALVGSLVFQLFSDSRRAQPVINGPAWGKLSLVSQLISNKPLILLCQLQGKRLVPLFAGLNKDDISRWLENEKFKCAIGMAMALFCLFKTHHIFKRAIRELFEIFKEQFQIFGARAEKRVKKIYEARVGDQQCCIICYNKCRNLIFRKCRHMILCNGCMRQNGVQNCPMCRVSIDNDYIKVMESSE